MATVIADQRAILRGLEGEIFDLVAAAPAATAGTWSEWLRVVLDQAAYLGNGDLTKKLLKAGAAGNALFGAIRGGHEHLAAELLQLGESPNDLNPRTGYRPLQVAAYHGGEQTIRALFEHGADKSVLDTEGRSTLHIAAMRGNAPACRALLAAGTPLNTRYGEGEWSALDLAARHGQVDVLRVLLENDDLDINASNSAGKTALHKAPYGGCADAIDILVEAGAVVDACACDRRTPLHVACERDDSGDVAEALIRHGADKDKLLSNRRSPLHLAARHGRFHVVKVLLAAGADVTLRYGTNNSSALDLACMHGHVGVVKVIIEHGVSVNRHFSDRWIPALHVAATNCNSRDVINMLVDAGAGIEATDYRHKGTPLMLACTSDNTEAVRALLQHGADANHCDTLDDVMPVHIAARNGNVDVLDALVAAGADLGGGEPSHASRTLCISAGLGHESFLKALLRHGANPNDMSAGSALHTAVMGGHPRIAETLLDAGVDVEQRREGSTPLHFATLNESSEFAELFLNRGANVNSERDDSLTPLHLVARNIGAEGGYHMAELLLRWGADEALLDSTGNTPKSLAERSFLNQTRRFRQGDLNDVLIGLRDSLMGSKRLLTLLRDSPSDRTWRRRGLVLLCRAFPEKLRLDPGRDASNSQTISPSIGEDSSKRSESGVPSDDGNASDFVGMATQLFGIKEGGVFRHIVMFL